MGTIDVTVWTVMQGDEDAAFLVGLDINRDRAKDAFERQAREIEAMIPQDNEEGALRVYAGCEWVELASRVMAVPFEEVLELLRRPAVTLIADYDGAHGQD